MSDYMVRATAAEGQIRIFAVTAKDLVESAKNHHNTSPVMTAALGRSIEKNMRGELEAMLKSFEAAARQIGRNDSEVKASEKI